MVYNITFLAFFTFDSRIKLTRIRNCFGASFTICS